MLDSILTIGAGAYHFGNAVSMKDILEKMPADALVMGNIDPAAQFMNGSPDSMRESVLALRRACASYPNFVLSSGCDIPPKASWDNIDAFFQAAGEEMIT